LNLLYYSDRAGLDSGMYSIGQRLREERLRRGLKLQDVAEQTRIRLTFLEAIEADRFDVLPGRFFARSFLRQYARLLEIEDPELESEITRQLGESEAAASAQQVLADLAAAAPQRAPVLSRTRPSARPIAYGAAGLLAVAAVLGLYFAWQQMRAGAQAKQQASQESRAAAAENVEGVPQTPAQGSGADQAASQAAPAQPSSAGTPPAEVAGEQAVWPLTAEVTAARASWIQVTGDGKVVFSDTLQAGQSRTFRAAQAIQIRTGNAGALEIRRNGQPIGPVGPEGQVRTIELTPQGHTITAPAPKPSAPDSEPQT